MATTPDCLIVGAGPAGSALALRLARRGCRVLLLDHGRARHSGPYESLLPTALPLLARWGLDGAVLAAAEPDERRHGVSWGEQAVQWRDGAGGLLLRRGAFDAALHAAAQAAGVEVLCPATAARTPDGAMRIVRADGTAMAVQPACVVLATGRARTPALAAPTVVATGPATTALTVVGTAPSLAPGQAVVEAVATGWIWTHVPSYGDASATVLLDRDQVGDGAVAAVQMALAAAHGPAAALRDAPLRHALDATARCLAADSALLRIGDAAATIDPLASQGVEKALAAADHATAVVLAGLRRTAWWPELRALHAQWEHGLFRAHQQAAAAWYGREQRFADSPFWRRRRPQAASGAPPDPATPLQLRSGIACEPVLVRAGDDCVRRDGARCRQSGDVLTHVGYVPVPPLLALFDRARRLGEATALAGRDPRLFPLPPRAVQGALEELRRRGWLTPATAAAAAR